MKAIFLSESPESVQRVYTARQAQELTYEAGLFPQVFRRQDLLADPAYFSNVVHVFSTWGMPALGADEIAACLPSLRNVFYAAGSVQSFARPFLARGVRVFSAWSANAVPVAEYAVAQILLANKGFFAASRGIVDPASRAAAAHRAGAFPGNYGCAVGILGAGQIGRRVIRALAGLTGHLAVKVFDPFCSDEALREDGAVRCGLDEIFATCQTISNHLANNAETRGMLGYALFSKMAPNATFINTGRGAQVVEEDLVRALREEPGRTAVLDVTSPEPPPAGHPFYALPNVVLTPHIAGSSGNEVHRMAQLMVDTFRRVALQGAGSDCEVTPEMLRTMA